MVRSAIYLLVLTVGVMPTWAGGPLHVTGPNANQQGQPYRWILNPIPYQTDLGGLGNQTNAQANAMVSDSFQVWQSANTSSISFRNSGQLAHDVTATNITAFLDAIGNCEDSTQPTNAILYDLNGSMMSQLGYDENSILGISEPVCADDTTGIYTRGWAILNGRFIDGRTNSPSHSSVTLEVFRAVLTHEVGHLIGLDHSQINLNCLTEASCPWEDLEGAPLMFPILLSNARATLKADDLAALGAIYPGPGFQSTTGRIQGRVLFSDGRTPAQGYNVIARLVGDPRRTAVSFISGYFFTAGISSPFAPLEGNSDQIYGARDPSLIGYYDLQGLPAGDYTIEVEAIYSSGETPFVDSTGVGPIGAYLGFQYKMPGRCDPQYLNFPSFPDDSCSAKSTVNVAAGVTVNVNTDIIFLGTPPRYDAWEDGP